MIAYDEFIKLKVAAYPGRIYYGNIDKTKIDEIYLDLYKLYGSGEVGKMEETATDFTSRLTNSRFMHYCGVTGDHFFQGDESQIWRTLFYATMGNPRTIGWILHYAYELHLIHGRGITVTGLADAARRYYEDKIESYFAIGKFLHEDFKERSSIYSLKELLEALVSRAQELRRHESAVLSKISGRPPTSHFHIKLPFERILSTLELNFFLTKYFEMSDRDGVKVAIYALNYGLCSKYAISFGRPSGEREFRLYFVERIFDFSPLVNAYLILNQEIVCDSCGVKQPFERLDALQMYGMKCPACGTGYCGVTNLSKKYEQDIQAINDNLLLPSTEIGILQTLHLEKNDLRPSEIAAELDCSYQLIGRRGRNLEERDLIERPKNETGQRYFRITALAEKSYFSDKVGQSLQTTEEPKKEVG